MLIEVNRRLVLRYGTGQFTFNNLVQTATDEQIHQLGTALNQFQEDEATDILRVQRFEMI